MVNASKLCREGGKQFKNWIRLEHVRNLVKVLELSGHEVLVFTHPVSTICGDTAAGKIGRFQFDSYKNWYRFECFRFLG